MDIFEAILLGMVQGLTEFLPVSSSGHLVLLQRMFGISEPVLIFDTLLHGATLIAVFIVLRKDIWAILRRPLQPLTGLLILATLPAVIAALSVRKYIEAAFENGAFLGAAFLVTSAALLFSESLARRPGHTRKGMYWLDAVIIGVLQAVAIIPGVSRSGFTLSGAISRRIDRDMAARFSFLLSIPAILGALALQVPRLPDFVSAESSIGAAPLIAGSLAAAVVGTVSVSLMLKIVREGSLRVFAAYTGVLGVLVLLDQFVTRLFF